MSLRNNLIAAALMLPLAALGARAAEDGPRVEHAWARATPGAAKVGAAYFAVETPTADRLVGVASPVAGRAEIHSHAEEGGVMKMGAVEGGVELPAGQRVELKPGGLHVMLFDLKRPLKEGDSFPLTLAFEKAGTRDVTVQVGKVGAMGAAAMHDHGHMHDDHMHHDADAPAPSTRSGS